MYNIIVVFSTEFEEQDFEKIFGECLEDELIRLGFSVRLPSFTDWGYVFRIEYGKYEFDIIIHKPEISKKTLSISIDSTLNWFQRLVSINDADDGKALMNSIENTLKSDSFTGKISRPFFVQG